jgi:predicted SAM-dependent methyltransferase/glycosyltransferase involved in cell wall biosynthesis
MKAPISMCIIVKNDPILEECLKSFKDFVQEIVIVDTGSTDGTAEIARKYANIFEVYTDCNDPETGLINDFSMARNRSFDLATQPWIMWCDSDDIIENAQDLFRITQEFEMSNKDLEGVAYLFPYEYSYDPNGKCICRHYRERLFYNKKLFAFTNPVHEVVIPKPGAKVALITREEVLFKHRRQFSNKIMEGGRNLRILRKHFEKVGESDARQMYYLGLECCNTGLIEEAIKLLSRYIEISGWDDERCMASYKLCDIYQGLGKFEEGLKWAFKSVEINEQWGEGYFALARMFYHLANNGGPQEGRNWERCAHFAKEGLKCPPTKTLLFVNPNERDVEIHKYLNFALNKTGRVEEALESTKTGLANQPDEPGLLGNKKLYEAFLSRNRVMEAANILKTNGNIGEEDVNNISKIINNQPLNILSTNNATIPAINTAILDNSIPNSSITINPINIQSYNDISILLSAEDRLDIVFFIGDGVEIWTPKTIKITGMGGSETAAWQISKLLAARGHRVRVFSGCGNDEGFYEGVEYLQSQKYQNLICDVLIVSRRADMLADQFNVQAKLKLLWVHDVYALNATNELLLKADRILALSNWHKQNIINVHNLHETHVITTRNGIDLARFDKAIPRNRFKAVNSSSPDRSWPVLLEVWPRIKAQVPAAELHLYYGFKNWEYSAQFQPGHTELIARLKQRIKELEPMGVVYHDRVNQQQLGEEFLSSGCWIYPTWFSETNCQLKGSFIFTKDGIKLIEDIKIGDLVLTHKGRFRKVTQLIQKEYDGNIYSIKRRKNFNPIVLTEEHPLLTATFHNRNDAKGTRVYNHNNLKVDWATPLELQPKLNYLLSPKMEFGNLTHIKLSDYIDLPVINGMIGPKIKRSHYRYVKNEIEITDEFMYMLGLFAAEGCSSAKRGKQKPNYSKITFAMHLREMPKAQRVINFFGSGEIAPMSEYGIVVIIYNSVWAKFMANQIGTGVSKRIPPFVWECSKEHQHAFMMGMFEGDGCKRISNDHNNAHKKYKSASYTSISPSLAYGMTQLLANQGIYADISFATSRRAYVIDWQEEAKCPQHIDLEAGFATRITNIQSEHYKGMVYNFEVEEDRSYVTDRTIVHNCISAMEAQAAGLRMVSSPIAALNETVADRGILIEGDWASAEYQNKFVAAVIEAMNKEENSDRLILQQYAKDHFSWTTLAGDWEKMFKDLIEELKTNPVVPYQPTEQYKATKKEEKPMISNTSTNQIVKLNIGCGPNIFPYDGWTNYDHDSEYFNNHIKLLKEQPYENIWTPYHTIAKYAKETKEHLEVKQHDIRKSFPQHGDNSVDVIYLGQVIEHINYFHEAPRLIKECYRMLKPKGVLRITTPDIELLLNACINNEMSKFNSEQPEFYKAEDPFSQLAMIMFGSAGENSTWDHFEGHQFLYGKRSMHKLLIMSGFTNIYFSYEAGRSHSPILEKETKDEGMTHSFISEAVK